jgi:N-formylglutamate amidohydrolase
MNPSSSPPSTSPRPSPLVEGERVYHSEVAVACDVIAPLVQTAPVVFASPHSGHDYPASFVAASQLDPVSLRRSEDAFIDELYEHAPRVGAPLIRAHFPRAYADPNREPWELDPEMFTDPLPAWVNTTSPRVRAGLGTVAKVVTDGAAIYKDKIPFAEAERRVETCYKPYHARLRQLLDATRDPFGAYLLIDCHSMPSIGGPMDRDPGNDRVDMVLGDANGTSCAPYVTNLVYNLLKDLGYRVVLNTPYAGGFTTRHYGTPGAFGHALQIEVNRALYMDEHSIARNLGFAKLATNLSTMIEAICAIDVDVLRR